MAVIGILIANSILHNPSNTNSSTTPSPTNPTSATPELDSLLTSLNCTNHETERPNAYAKVTFGCLGSPDRLTFLSLFSTADDEQNALRQFGSENPGRWMDAYGPGWILSTHSQDDFDSALAIGGRPIR